MNKGMLNPLLWHSKQLYHKHRDVCVCAQNASTRACGYLHTYIYIHNIEWFVLRCIKPDTRELETKIGM